MLFALGGHLCPLPLGSPNKLPYFLFVPGGRGELPYERDGMLLVSLRGGIVVWLRVFWAKWQLIRYIYSIHINKVFHNIICNWSLLRVCISFGHAQIGVSQGLNNSKFPTSIPVPSIWESPPGTAWKRRGLSFLEHLCFPPVSSRVFNRRPGAPAKVNFERKAV